MIKILLVDDKQEKQQHLAEIISQCELYGPYELISVTDINSAKRTLSIKEIDILLLDLNIPRLFTSKPILDGGVKLLQEIENSSRYSYPKYVISVSEYEESIDKFHEFSKYLHASVNYSITDTSWITSFKNFLVKATQLVTSNITIREYNYDVAIICALNNPELDSVLKTLQKVKTISSPHDNYRYYHGEFIKEGIIRKAVLCSSPTMGMVPAAVLALNVVHYFSPKYLIMPGILAGLDHTKVALGDVIVAESVWDYQAGKEVVTDGQPEHRNSIQQIAIETDIVNKFKCLAEDTSRLSDIKKSFQGNTPSNELKIHVGQVVSGAAVIADGNIADNLVNGQSRNILGLEMELFGVFHSAKWSPNPKPKFFGLKSVCDFADEQKNDDYQKYAAYTSAKVLEIMVLEYLEFDA